jgi:hypothetical protein
MSLKLCQALHDALSRVPKDANPEQPIDPKASVLVQFAAGDFQAVRDELERAKVELGWKDKHDIADAAGVPSHEQSGSPLPVDKRIDMAADTLPPVSKGKPEPLHKPAPGGDDTRKAPRDRREP